jgi:flagellar L-ring protein precursor FlgH
MLNPDYPLEPYQSLPRPGGRDISTNGLPGFNTNTRKACSVLPIGRSLGSFCAHLFFMGMLLVSSLLSSGCAITPDSIVKQPMTAKPPVAASGAASSGAIFNSAAYRPLFEDRRPRYVGDIVTINITENTTATKAGGSSGSKDGKVDASISSLFNHPVPKATFAASASDSYADKAAANSSNAFNGSITATVVEVLPNGFLVVSGEKQVSLDKGTEFIRFSGVINPDTITPGNFVLSTKVADARIEYRTNSKIDAAEIASMFARFFLSMVAL